MKKILLGLSLGLAVNCAAAATASAQNTQTDFDSDGTSDYAQVTIQNDKTLAWSYLNAVSLTASAIATLGESGDHLIPASWKSAGAPLIGVVTVDDSSKAIMWKILNSGVVEERELGNDGGTAIAGADFNGNGIADAAAAKLKKNRVEWSVSYDMFTRGVGQENEIKVKFGVAGDRIFYASPDGTTDWLGVVGKNSAGRTALKLKNLSTGEVRSITGLPSFIVKAPRPRPFPVRSPSGPDVLAFSKQNKGGNTDVYFYNLDGSLLVQGVLPGKGDIVVGNFNSNAGEEVAIKTSSGYTVYNPFNGQQEQITAAGDFVPTDEININTVGGSSSGGSGGNGGGGSGGNGDGDNEGGPSSIAACKSIASWPGSHIYKTVGSHHFTDVRRNTAGVIIKPGGRGPFPQCISLVDTKGGVVANMGLYATGNGWAARYYAGIGCGSSTALNGSAIARVAQSRTGSSSVYANFGSVCYGPINATQCIGSQQC